MFENEGFCPSNSFYNCQFDRNPLANEIMKILGDQKGYMVYSKNGYAWDGEDCSIVNALIGGEDGILGMKVASYLNSLDPNCKYAEHGKKIVITDYINPYQISDKLGYIEEGGHYKFFFCHSSVDDCEFIDDGVRLFYDQRYLLTIKDGDVIEVKIWRIPQKK